MVSHLHGFGPVVRQRVGVGDMVFKKLVGILHFRRALCYTV